MNNFTVIASAFRANLSMEHNLARHEDAMNTLVDAGMCDLKTAMGVYQEEGQAVASREVSIINANLSWDEVKRCVELFCKRFEQDCILVINQDTGACCLKGADWADHIGHWQEVTRQEAKEVGIYTLDTNGKYWMAA